MSATVHPLRPSVQSPPPCIAPMNVKAYVASILDTASALMRMGHEVMAFQAEVTTRTPLLWLKDSPALRNMARCGQASYDRTGSDASGAYRIGVFQLHECTVQWLERVPG